MYLFSAMPPEQSTLSRITKQRYKGIREELKAVEAQVILCSREVVFLSGPPTIPKYTPNFFTILVSIIN